MTVYYNEIDPYAAQWLRNLIAAGHIAPGDVDERSIKDVKADDLRGYAQCHFFAGIGVWSYALRLAGWPDDRPVWTGSCPCQPLSAAGKQAGTADERHLWPAWFNLIEKRKPPVVFGEQVEAAIRHGWLDLVQSDMEGIGYAFAAAGIPAAGFGAPHIRQRLWFVADAELPERRPRDFRGTVDDGQTSGRVEGADRLGERRDPSGLDHYHHPRLEGLGGGHQAEGRQREGSVRPAASSGESGGVADATNAGHEWGRAGKAGNGRDTTRLESERLCDPSGLDHHHHPRLEGLGSGHQAEGRQREGSVRPVAAAGESGGVADTEHTGHRGSEADASEQGGNGAGNRLLDRGAGGLRDARPGPTNGHWRNADWLHCRDGKWRPVEPGTFPLAHGAAARVGRLRAYGNAIVPQVAAEVIAAFMECRPC